MKKTFFAGVASATALLTIVTTPALADGDHKHRIDDHAPIGVMADHFHKKGEVMASLRWMGMNMGDPINTAMGPQSMDMNMVMAGVMYAPSDKLTLAAMLNYSDTSMDMIMMGNEVEMGASEIGDLRLNAIIPIMKKENSRFHVTLGASVPLGDTAEVNPMGARMALTMQPGTGSWGFTPSATYSQFMEGWSFGAQANAKIWVDDNNQGERMGDSFELTSWAAVPVSENVSLSARLSYVDRSAVKGSAAVLLTDEREVLNGLVGANFLVGGHRLAVEAGLPLWQDRGLNALDVGFNLMVGWQKAF